VRPPRRPALRKLIASVSLVLVAALAQAAERGIGPAEPTARPATPRYKISGKAVGLFPGARTTMRLTVRNPNPYPIKVRKIRTTVRSGAASCPSKTVRVARSRGTKRIPARSRARVKVKVRMLPTAPDSCAGRRYRLIYRGLATRA
jgi:hypothetical protein